MRGSREGGRGKGGKEEMEEKEGKGWKERSGRKRKERKKGKEEKEGKGWKEGNEWNEKERKGKQGMEWNEGKERKEWGTLHAAEGDDDRSTLQGRSERKVGIILYAVEGGEGEEGRAGL